MRARVVSNSCIKGPYYKLILKPSCLISARPGQFLMIRSSAYSASTDPLLSRPFSIYKLTQDGNVEILYRVVGKGTVLLKCLDAGEEIEILGPLGNGFEIDSGYSAEEFLIIAGGIGVAPMVGIAEVLRSSYPEKTIVVFSGGRGEVDLLCIEDLAKVATEVIIATEDGSAGFKGYVTGALETYLYQRLRTQHSVRRTVIFACGPSPMLRRIYEIARPLSIETYFSIEATMGCGIGICMGCAVKRSSGGYYLACKDGPVFRGEAIEFS